MANESGDPEHTLVLTNILPRPEIPDNTLLIIFVLNIYTTTLWFQSKLRTNTSLVHLSTAPPGSMY